VSGQLISGFCVFCKVIAVLVVRSIGCALVQVLLPFSHFVVSLMSAEGEVLPAYSSMDRSLSGLVPLSFPLVAPVCFVCRPLPERVLLGGDAAPFHRAGVSDVAGAYRPGGVDVGVWDLWSLLHLLSRLRALSALSSL